MAGFSDSSDDSGDITRLIDDWQAGDCGAAEHLCQLLYQHLHQMAVGRLRGEARQVTLDAERHGQRDEVVDLIELEAVLEKLEAQDKRKARAIELYYFGGLDYNEMAAELGVSRATAHRELRFARAFLAAELGTAEG